MDDDKNVTRNGALSVEGKRGERWRTSSSSSPPPYSSSHLKRKRGASPSSSSSSSSSDSSSQKKKRSKRKNSDLSVKKRKNKKKDTSSSSSSSSSDNSSSSSSSSSSSESSDSDAATSSSSEEKKKKKKDKKKQKEKSRKDKKDKKGKAKKTKKKIKKPKKEKKKKEKSPKKKKDKGEKRMKQMNVGAVTNQWGRYGHIEEHDMWTKRQEFQLWLLEIKDVSLETLSSWEEKQHFKTYMEDFNTATLPHKKYYNLARWEEEYQQKHKSKPRREAEMSTFNDEARRKEEIKQMRQNRDMERLRGECEAMKEDVEKVESMRRQKVLRTRMDMLFKMGRNEEAQKIQEMLKPDEK